MHHTHTILQYNYNHYVYYKGAMFYLYRDLKPENILLDENMHIQITDFGTAKIIEGGNGMSKRH